MEKDLKASMEAAFKKPLRTEFLQRDIYMGFLEQDYRGGAVLTRLAGIPYLSKFWVVEAAQGEGLARDIWDKVCAQVPAFFWRSRRDNPFNDWYMRHCGGMQVSGDWRVVWIGLSAPEVPGAIIAAASAADDFSLKPISHDVN